MAKKDCSSQDQIMGDRSIVNIRINAGFASVFFITDEKKNLVLIENPYLIFSNTVLTVGLFAEILANVYNLEHTKGFLGTLLKKAEKDAVERFLEDLINERKISPTLMGSSRSMVVFAKGIQKSCLFSMKILKLRGFSSLAAVNLRDDFERGFSTIKGLQEIAGAEVCKDDLTAIFRPSKLRVAVGKHATVISTGGDFAAIIKEHMDLVTPVRDARVNDASQVADEGVYD